MNKVHFHKRKASIYYTTIVEEWLYYGSIKGYPKSVTYTCRGKKVKESRPKSVLESEEYYFEEVTRLEVLILTGISEDRVRSDLNDE